jgi:Putative Ig domain
MSPHCCAFRLPADAFVHTQEYAVVRLSVERIDGGPLPNWLKFDATTGMFEGDAPDNAPAEIDVRVTARDTDGREASTIFRIKLSAADKNGAVGRVSLSDQLRTIGARSEHLNLLAQMSKHQQPTKRVS